MGHGLARFFSKILIVANRALPDDLPLVILPDSPDFFRVFYVCCGLFSDPF